MKKEEILDNAKQLIAGQRAVDYGDAKDNFDRIAAGLEPDLGEAHLTRTGTSRRST
jgi:hypothetical protein